MKRRFVRDLVEGAHVDDAFSVRSRDLRCARTGDAYLALELGDRSGSIRAVLFRPSPSDEAIPVGTVARVRGTVTAYRGVRRISIESLDPQERYDREDMLPSGIRDRSELVGELRELVRGVRHRGLRKLLTSFFSDTAFMERYCLCPASRHRHHAYVGGLLEHSIDVAFVCRDLAARDTRVDADLLVAAALLHDVGKIDGLAFDTTVESTDVGRLLGHVAVGERIVSERMRSLATAIDGDTALALSHAMLAHHGRAEWGSPVPPATLEALLLHHADLMSSELSTFTEAVAGATLLEERWTDGANAFGHPLRVPGRARERAFAKPECAGEGPCPTIGAVPRTPARRRGREKE